MASKWPKTVPVLTNGKPTHIGALADFAFGVFWMLEGNDLSSVYDALNKAIRSAKTYDRARVWNLAMRSLGYTEIVKEGRTR